MTESLRILGIVAHIDAGKTTLTERSLFDAGVQPWCGEVDDGTATMDWMRQERERGISIVAAATGVSWREHQLQIVDTPGHVDFTAEVERCLRVLDGVIVVIDSVRGVESQTQTVWHKADRWNCARLAFINKMDRAGADFVGAVASMAECFDCRPIPVVVPLFGHEGVFSGLGDPIRGSAIWFAGDVPQELQSTFAKSMRAAREVAIEACCDFDDSILADYVAGKEIAPDRMLAALRRGCIQGELVPVLCGAALHDQGVDWLLDAVCDLLPSPVDRCREGMEAAFPRPDPDAPLSALVFKVEHEEEEVRNYLRVFTGALRCGDEVQGTRGSVPFAVGDLWSMHASHHESVTAALPGEIVVLPGALGLQTGETLYPPGALRRLPMPQFSPPVIGAMFEPATPADGEPLEQALLELLGDDPSLRVEADVDSGLPVVFGMGELHLEIVAARIRERRICAFSTSRPRVALRATVAGRGEGRATIQVPGVAVAAATATADVSIEPSGGELAEVEVDVGPLGGHRLAASLGEELQQRGRSGLLLGYPAMRVTVQIRELLGGDREEPLLLHAVDTALAKAVEAAAVVDLEPIVDFEVRCTAEQGSVVLADLAARGASIRQVSSGQLGALLEGRGRLRAFLGYATRLRSLTRGQGEVQLLPAGYRAAAEGPSSATDPVN